MALNNNTLKKVRMYSDLNLNFLAHPVSKDILKRNDEEAVKASIRNLISTQPYERPFRPEIGCQIYGLLFENFDPIIIELAKKTIKDVITKFEPRAIVDSINLEYKNDHDILAEVTFRVINTDKPLTVTNLLRRVR